MAGDKEKEAKKPKKKKTVKKEIVKKETVKEVPVKKEEKIVKETKPVVEEVKKEEPVVETKKKKTKTYKTSEAITIMIMSIVIGIIIGCIFTRLKYEKHEDTELKEFSGVYREVKDNSYKKPSRLDLFYSSISGLLSGLNDRYAYLNNDKAAILSYDEEINGTFIGLGINVTTNEAGEIIILSVMLDSPAEKAGLESNDVLLKIDENNYNADTFYDFSYDLKTSSIGRKIKLEIQRDNVTMEKEIVLDEIEVDSSIYELKESNGKKIAYITINNFANNTYDQFYKNYEKAVEDGAEGIIIDVRCNLEGNIENASKIASLFLNKGAVIYQYYENGTYEPVKNKNDKVINLPAVVLVNDGTVSSGELIASALNENLGTPIVGTKTYGKGLIQKVVELFNGRYVTFSVKEWVTSNKNKVEEVGITPTHEISNECETDEGLEKAIELLTVDTE